jgi:hypothetical protein
MSDHERKSLAYKFGYYVLGPLALIALFAVACVLIGGIVSIWFGPS